MPSSKDTTLTKDEVRHLARLARISLSEEEVTLFQQQLTEVIDYNMSLLAEVDVSGIEPTAQITGLTNVWAEDVVVPSLAIDVVLQAAPHQRDNQFVVPQVLGDA
jgi:aspartyl-tRNA(Asn)/glutamyl-tRNA(Gln) amidotransferase subunit C